MRAVWLRRSILSRSLRYFREMTTNPVVVYSVFFLCVLKCNGAVTDNSMLNEAVVYNKYSPDSNTVCYGVLGCFSNSGPFGDFLRRPFQPLPDSPGEIATKFYLYTRAHHHYAVPLWSWNSDNLNSSDFDGEKKTKIIVHGYLNNEGSPWVKDMSDRLLRVGDFNVIAVDWIYGAVDLYQHSAVNTRVVGAEIWYLLKKLNELKGLRFEDVHIIGHSLGAHVAGYAGERLPGIGRISGLDPAKPYFENMDPVVRLDPSDAQFVDVIHTDIKSFIGALGTGGYGISHPIGHVDFYPNGGGNQPECSTEDILDVTAAVGIFEGLRMFISCNHMRAIYLYIESIDENPSCSFTSFPCTDYEAYLAGRCAQCGEQCAKMGYYADQVNRNYTRDNNNQFYLATASFPKYCRENYFLRIVTDVSMAEVKGQIFVNIEAGSKSTGFRELTKGPENINACHPFLLLSNVTISKPTSISLKWVPKSTWLGLGILGNTGEEELYSNLMSISGPNMRAIAFQDARIAAKSIVTSPLEFLTQLSIAM